MKTSWLGSRGEGYVIIQFILFAILFFVPPNLSGWPEWSSPWNTIGLITGLALGSLGALLILAGLFYLGSNLTAVPHPKADSQLVQNGAYAFVRHPIYSGIILGSFGLGLMRNGLLTLFFAFLLFLFFDIKSRQEEVWLSQKFAEYRAYQKRVRKLIPFVY